MSTFIAFVALAVAAVLLGALWGKWRRAARIEYIRNYRFPVGLFDKLSLKHPQLARKDEHLVAQALRQFFLAYLLSGRKYVSMPSQVADDLWHEFILYTRNYARFCDRAFGRFLHHTPAVALSGHHQNNTGLRRVWWQCCKQENLDPRKPLRMPLLFAIDAKLQIANGFVYVLDCTHLVRRDDGGSSAHCGSDMNDPGFDGTTDGFGDSAGDGGSGGGDSGGDGCGGGGCGGD